MNHKASREAYAREHGLSADYMLARVHGNRSRALLHRWQADFNKIVQFKTQCIQARMERDLGKSFTVVGPPIFRSVFVGDNRANVVHIKFFGCPRCGSQQCEGSCGHFCKDVL